MPMLPESEEARAHVAKWIVWERGTYADTKYEDGTDRRDPLVEAMQEGDWQRWIDFAGQYLKKAEIFGFDTPRGRQQLGKAIITVMHMTETAVMVHGPMPMPGLSSTEDIQEWSEQ